MTTIMTSILEDSSIKRMMSVFPHRARTVSPTERQRTERASVFATELRSRPRHGHHRAHQDKA